MVKSLAFCGSGGGGHPGVFDSGGDAQVRSIGVGAGWGEGGSACVSSHAVSPWQPPKVRIGPLSISLSPTSLERGIDEAFDLFGEKKTLPSPSSPTRRRGTAAQQQRELAEVISGAHKWGRGEARRPGGRQTVRCADWRVGTSMQMRRGETEGLEDRDSS